MAILEALTAALFGGKDKSAAGRGTKRGEDLRSVKRTPQRMRSGFVWNDKLISPRTCMIRDLSVKGARIDIIGEPIKAAILAEGIRLYFDTEKHEVRCKVAWSQGQSLGLRFEGRPLPPSRQYK